jgi:hypothetical protein
MQARAQGAAPVEPPQQAPAQALVAGEAATAAPRPVEIGGPTGPEPTRFGDWEKSGRCIDF